MFPSESVTVKICPECPARMATAIKFPAVLLAMNAKVAELVVPASKLLCCTRAMGTAAGCTVKFAPLLTWPPIVTTTLPVAAPAGTGTVMPVAPQLVGDADVPLKVTVLVPWLAPKFAPAIVTVVPTVPNTGLRLVMVGDGVTVKFTPLLATPRTVTTTLPLVAPLGTGATMLVAFQPVGVAAVPVNVTVLAPCDAPKFVPVIVTGVPTGPLVGFRLLILGVGGVTVKATPLLFTPVTSTTTFPVVAPVGTAAVMLVADQLLTAAVVPLKMTALVPCVAPKFVPVMTTDVPTGPEVGLKLVMLGGAVTVNGTPLLATPPTVTTTLPVVAPAGTWTVILTELHPVTAIEPAEVPLKVTVLVPWDEPKFAPEIKISAPTAPEDGFRLVMLGGGGITVKFKGLLATPLRTTPTLPVVAPEGTVTLIFVSLQLVTVALTPLKITVLVPWVAPKLVPVMVTGVPTAPDVGLKLLIVGDGITVKLIPLLVPLLVVTTTGPEVAPIGMKAAILVSFHLVTPKGVPLSVRVLVCCPVPKLVPVMVMEVPSKPEVGFKLVMVGAGMLKFTPLLPTTPSLTVTTFVPVSPAGTDTTIVV